MTLKQRNARYTSDISHQSLLTERLVEPMMLLLRTQGNGQGFREGLQGVIGRVEVLVSVLVWAAEREDLGHLREEKRVFPRPNVHKPAAEKCAVALFTRIHLEIPLILPPRHLPPVRSNLPALYIHPLKLTLYLFSIHCPSINFSLQ